MIHNKLPQFVFMTCRPGAETALKQEIARSDPEWRPAFSRPGFVTFKLNGPKPLHEEQLAARHWVFARAHGLSLGQADSSELAEMAAEMWQLEGVAELVADDPSVDVHVWQREAETIDDDRLPTVVTPLAQEIEAAIRAAAPDSCKALHEPPSNKRRPTPRNRRVLDIVVIEPDQWSVGFHRTTTRVRSWPGGVIPLRLPEHAVSRAYAKMEEALTWSDLPLAAGDECVEIGCAPGGACQALLDRGMFVTGIDPAEVDPAVLAHPRFRQLRKRGHEVRRSEFVGVRWLAADVNLAPGYALDTVEAIVNHPQVTIRGLILTLKLADWSHADRLPEFAARVHGWGFRDVRLRQLASGGQEVCLVALRRKELRRLNRKTKTRRRGRSAGGSKRRHSDKPHDAGETASVGGRTRRDPPHSALSGPHF